MAFLLCERWRNYETFEFYSIESDHFLAEHAYFARDHKIFYKRLFSIIREFLRNERFLTEQQSRADSNASVSVDKEDASTPTVAIARFRMRGLIKK